MDLATFRALDPPYSPTVEVQARPDRAVSATGVGLGVSALYYLSNRDNLRTYVAPRWTYSHSEPGNGTSVNTHTIGGLFGAQYALGKRFSVFGETGLTYGHSTAKSDLSILSVTVKSDSFGTQTGAGVILSS